VRILHVIASLDPGGAECVVLSLAAAATENGADVAIASGGGAWLARAQAMGIQTYHVPTIYRSPTRAAMAMRTLRRALRAFRPDVVHAHNVGCTMLAAASLRPSRAGTPLVTSFHGVPHEAYRRAALILRSSPARVIACSPSIHAALVGAGFPARRSTTIVNGARLEPADEGRVTALRELYEIPADAIVAVGVGRLVDQKAWDRLIDASRRLTGMEVVVAGEGPLLETLKQLARGTPVRFLDKVDDVPALLATARCLVSTSRWEGLPIAMLEAVSLGVPVVATSVDGVRDLLSADSALLVESGDPAAIGCALQKMRDDDELAGRLSDGARAVAASFSPERMAERYWEVYRDEVGGPTLNRRL